jgi:hypothetical protein
MKNFLLIFLFFISNFAFAQDINRVSVYLEEGEKGKDSYATIKEVIIGNNFFKFSESYTGRLREREKTKLECELTKELKDELKNLIIKNDFLKNTIEIFNILSPASYKKIKINIESSQGNFRTEFEGAQFDYRSSETAKKIEPLLSYLMQLYTNSNLKCKQE